ncbi:MAG: hypothetical protein JSR91_08735 [Proteobacteria bacterium]|nr:hypothetical protein [Pseudomonadota bacterium]
MSKHWCRSSPDIEDRFIPTLEELETRKIPARASCLPHKPAQIALGIEAVKGDLHVRSAFAVEKVPEGHIDEGASKRCFSLQPLDLLAVIVGPGDIPESIEHAIDASLDHLLLAPAPDAW